MSKAASLTLSLVSCDSRRSEDAVVERARRVVVLPSASVLD